MTILALLVGLLVLSVLGALAVLLARNPLKAALSTLLVILSGVVASFVSADASANAGGSVRLPWFTLDFNYVYLNPTRPEWLWVLIFGGTGGMFLYVATLIHKDRMRQPPGA